MSAMGIENERNKQIRRLQQQLAVYKRLARANLGEKIWGLHKKPDDKFTHEEVLFLFARIFFIYGFKSIKAVRTSYPDVIATRDEKEVGIEIEPLLSSFKSHMYQRGDLSVCDYVVCWNDDLDRGDELRAILKENGIEVIELKEIYSRFETKQPPVRWQYNQDDIERLSDGQYRILSTYIISKKNILTREEMQNTLGKPGKALGGWVKGFTEQAKKRSGLLGTHPEGISLMKNTEKWWKRLS